MILNFGYWLNGAALVWLGGHFAHDWELQSGELEEAAEEHPTSSVQEVLREPASQAVPGQCVHNVPQRWPLVAVPQWRGWTDTEFLGQPLSPLWFKGHSASSWQWKDHIYVVAARSLKEEKQNSSSALSMAAPRNSVLVAAFLLMCWETLLHCLLMC